MIYDFFIFISKKNLFQQRFFWVIAAVIILASGFFVSAARAALPGYPLTPYRAGNAPNSVVAADFNNDTFSDFAVTNYSDDNVSVFLNNQDGTFATRVNYPVGEQPWSVVAADFNKDGKIDLATANFVGSNVSVLMGNGDGTFASAVNYAVPGSPDSIVTADFNGDGYPDLAVTTYTGNKVYILLNNGDGTFTVANSYDTGNTPWYLATGDFDGDSHADLALINRSDDSFSIFLGAGDGTFGSAITSAPGLVNRGIFSYDFNGDGKDDLAIGGPSVYNVSIFLSTGGGSFASPMTYDVDGGEQSITGGDFNHDGIIDLATANWDNNSISVILGSGGGNFGAATNYPVSISPAAITAADFDKNNYDDLVDVNQDSNTADVFLNVDGVFNIIGPPPTVYPITSCQDLQDIDTLIGNNPDAAYYDFKITVPTFSCAGMNGGDGFYPITNLFYGILDGNGANITNLKIYDGGDPDVGLFEDLESGATIKNLTLSGNSISYISGGSFGVLAGAAYGNIIIQNVTSNITHIYANDDTLVGGLIGDYEADNGTGLTIENSRVSSAISASNSQSVGGLVGNFYSDQGGEDLITGSVFSGTISADGSQSAGGLMGYLEADANENILFSSSSASGNISGGSDNGNSATGGLIGHYLFSGDAKLTISNCHFSGAQITDGDSNSGNDSVGGLLGWFDNESDDFSQKNIIIQSYSSGNVISHGNTCYAGGLVGQLINNGGCVGSCLGGFDVLESSSSGAVTGGSLDAGGSVGGLVGSIGSANGVSVNFLAASSSVSGAVSGDGDVGGLAGSAYGSTSIQNFTADMPALTVGNDSEGSGGLIGYYEDDEDNLSLNISNSHVLSAISVSSGDGNALVGGLIGELYSDANVEHSIDDSVFSGSINGVNSASTGGLVGYLEADGTEDVSISSSSVSGTGITGGDNTGGLIGYFNFQGDPLLTISKSNFSGSQINGGSNVGGLLGYFEVNSASYSQFNVISQSYSTGAVNSSDGNAGGLIGQLQDDENCGTSCSGGFIVSASYASGDVTGSDDTGGLIGVMNNGNFSVVNSYASGEVDGEDYVGGLVGDMYQDMSVMSVDRSFFSGSVSGDGSYVGGLVGDLEGASALSNSFNVGEVSNSDTDGALVGGADNENGLVNDYWYDSLDNGIGNGAEDTSVGKFVKVDSADYFQNSSTNAPLDQWAFSGPNPVWVTNEGDYPSINTDYTSTDVVHQLHYAAGSNGSIIGAATQNVFDGADGSAVTAVPDDGYIFVNWDDNSTANPRIDTDVTSDNSVTANFGINPVHEITSCDGLQGIDQMIIDDPDAAYYDFEITVPTIDCSDVNGTGIFKPIASEFYGTLNGNNAKIINFNINDNSDSNIGLFSDLESGATIENLSLSGDSVSSDSGAQMGLLAGYATGNITIANVTSTVSDLTVGDNASEIGGLIGYYVDYGGSTLILSNDHSATDISAVTDDDQDVGGLVGMIWGLTSGEYSVGGSDFSGTISAAGSESAGGLVGWLKLDSGDSMNISTSSASGDISGGSEDSSSGFGGLIGYYAMDGDAQLTISQSHYSGSQISGDGNPGSVGGLLGVFYDDSDNYTKANIISQSYSSANVVSGGGNDFTGGLVGQLDNAGNCSGDCSGSFAIDESYSSGNVTDGLNDSGACVGGVVGAINIFGDNLNFSLASSSASGSVSGDYQVGGLIGQAYGHVNLQNVTSSAPSVIGGVDSTAVGGLIGLYLNDDGGDGLVVSNALVSSDISATNSNSNPDVAGMVGNFSSLGGANNSITNSSFSGSISNNANGDSTGGAFGYLEADNNENISLVNIDVGGNIDVPDGGFTGGLIGYYWFHGDSDAKLTIDSCRFTGGHINGGVYVGGLLGFFENSSNFYSQIDVISGSYSTGKINGSGDDVGGLVGMLEDDENCGTSCSGGLVISSSYNSGDVSSDESDFVGGLVGDMLNGNFSIENSYNLGNISGNGQVGGLAGDMEKYLPIMSIDRSYSSGTVFASADYAGGLVGNLQSGNLSNSFSVGDVSGGGSNIGGLVGTAGNENDLTNDYWFDSLDNGVGNGAEDTSAGHFVKADSASVFQDNSINPPLDQWSFSGPNPVWLTEAENYPVFNPDYVSTTTVYNLDYSAGANGSLSGNLSQFVFAGADGTAVTAVPDNGYQFVNWSDSSTDNPRTDTNVTQDISVTANFAVNSVTQYTLTYSAGDNGSITGDSPQTVNSGSSGTIVTAIPDDGYHFVNWSDGSTINPRTDSNVTQDISVTANFAAGSINPITSCQDLQDIDSLITNNPAAAHYDYEITTSTIDCAGINGTGNFAPIENDFYGTLDGNNARIINFNINDNTDSNIGLFGDLENGATIKNLSISGDLISTTGLYVGVLSGYSQGNIIIQNVTSTIAEIKAGNAQVIGGLTGEYIASVSGQGLVIDNSHVSTNIFTTSTVGYFPVGGLIGDFDSTSGEDQSSVVDSVFSGNINSHGGEAVGGLIGSMEPEVATDFLISSSSVGGSISNDSLRLTAIGGLIGAYNFNSDSKLTISQSHFSGDQIIDNNIGNRQDSVGGLLGFWENYASTYSQASTISQSYSTGNINSNSNSGYVGGLVGQMYNDGDCSGDCSGSFTISQSYASGNINSNSSGAGVFTGGLIGAAGDGNTSVIDSYSSGNVSGDNYVGGLVGDMSGVSPISSIDRSYSSGAVSGNGEFVGGLVGDLEGGNLLNNSFNAGSVSGGSDVGGLAGSADDQNGLVNDYWFDSLAKGVGNIVPNTSSGHFTKADSDGYFQDNGNNPPLDQWSFSGPNQVWRYSEASYPTFNRFYHPLITTFTLAYVAGANGSITGSSTQIVDSGSDGTEVTATPDNGYHFVNWSDSSTQNPRTDIDVTQDISVTANFAANPLVIYHTLIYLAGAHGSITGSSTQVIASSSAGTAITAVADSGYHFVNWSDSSTQNPRTDTDVVQDISVTANFAANPITQYILAYAAGANGLITGSSTQVVNSGANGTAVTAVANSGYQFVSWSDSSTANPRTDRNVSANISVAAAFAVIPVSPGGGGGGGGGGASSLPIPSVKVNSISTKQESTPTTLTITFIFNVANAAFVAISEDPDFPNAVWQPYSPAINFIVPSGAGLNNLYVKFRSSSGLETPVQRIGLTLSNMTEVPVTAQPVVTTPIKPNPVPPAKSSTVNSTKPVVKINKFIFTEFMISGSTGVEVRQLQLKLQQMGYFPPKQKTTGIFGPTTKQAVIKLQKFYKLKPALGYVGPGTRAVLNSH
jgi:Divergent InlB B-repeat domain/FG-GAP-like repeat/Putative peptidoglycan binding domain